MTEEQWEGLFEFLRVGGSLNRWCRENEVPKSNVLYWVQNNTFGNSDQYARARELGIESRLDGIREYLQTEPDVQRAREVANFDRWEASKLLPKKYGDRSTIALENVTTDKLIDVLVQTEDK